MTVELNITTLCLLIVLAGVGMVDIATWLIDFVCWMWGCERKKKHSAHIEPTNPWPQGDRIVIHEGSHCKGGVNFEPTTHRPPPPKGQVSQHIVDIDNFDFVTGNWTLDGWITSEPSDDQREINKNNKGKIK